MKLMSALCTACSTVQLCNIASWVCCVVDSDAVVQSVIYNEAVSALLLLLLLGSLSSHQMFRQ